MLGVRFLDADFMRINFACGLPTVWLKCFFCTVVKGEAAAWSASRSQCRMEAPERARSMVARAAGQPHFCLATERLCGPPGRGDFLVSNFHPDVVAAAIDAGVHERAPLPGQGYPAYADAAGGTGADAFAVAVAHREADGTVVLDALRMRAPRFVPEA